METENGYFNETTPSVRMRTMFERDFINPGNFYENDDDNELNLMYDIWVGKFDDESFQHIGAAGTNETSYRIDLYYYNKENVRINFNSSYGMSEDLQPTFDFMKEVAKKFFLVTTVDTTLSEQLNFATQFNPTWEEIEAIIADRKRKSNDIRTGNSWYKTMTAAEAKELMAYIKVKVDFPYWYHS